MRHRACVIAVVLAASRPVAGAEKMGTLDKEEIQAVIHQGAPQVRSCYERALLASPSVEGKVVVKFVIGVDGQVASAQVVEDTARSEPLSSCLKARLLTWSFPRPRGDGVVVVTYPFLFKPSGESGEGLPPAKLFNWPEKKLELRLARTNCSEGTCQGRAELWPAGRQEMALQLNGLFPDGTLVPERGPPAPSWVLKPTAATFRSDLAGRDGFLVARPVRVGKDRRAVHLTHGWVRADRTRIVVHRVFLIRTSPGAGSVQTVLELSDLGTEKGFGLVKVEDVDHDGLDEVVLSGGHFTELHDYPGQLTYRWDAKQERFAP